MKQQCHATIKIEDGSIKKGVDMDILIHETLADMVTLHGSSLRLVDFKIYEIETQRLPPRRETFLTIMAEEVQS